MMLTPLICPFCQQPEAIHRHGKSPIGMQRYRCGGCHRTFQVRYNHQVHVADTRVRITVMALNGSSIRDTARVLSIDPRTVAAELKRTLSR